MSFLWERPPRVVGHRGSPREAPENTMASFRAAVAAGAQAIELDVRLSADGALVVHHDDVLGRTVAGVGRVEDVRAEALLGLDAGGWFAPSFSGERVPTLMQVLQELPSGLLLDVELKADAGNALGLPARVAGVVREAGALDRTLVTSFDPALADEYARLVGRPAGSILPFAPEPVDLADWPRLTYFALAEDAVSEEVLAMCRGAGRKVLVWTVNDAEAAGSLLAQGASSIITDRPGPLLARLREGAPGP